jgi:hypothetical protein
MKFLRWLGWSVKAAPQIFVAYVTGDTDADLPDTPGRRKPE